MTGRKKPGEKPPPAFYIKREELLAQNAVDGE